MCLILMCCSLPISIFAKEEMSNDKYVNTMAIAMATDNNFVLPTIVAMTSILENANKDSFYKFYILKSGDLETENEKKFLDLKNSYKEKCSVKFFKMSNEFEGIRTLKHITSATLFRLRLPSLLKNEEKCLYLDGDIIVQEDLKELYNTDISNYYVAGVRGIGDDKLRKVLKNNNIRLCINAGVLLMNLKRMRKDNIEEKFNKFIPTLKNKKLYYADQDIINAVCCGKIYALPFKYNTRSWFQGSSYNQCKKVYKCTKKEYEETKKHIAIIHYTTSKKPWKDSSVKFGNIWWEYAKKTKYLEEIQKKYDFEK